MVINPGSNDDYKWLPYVIFFLACCFVALLLSGIKSGVFFSGDAGLKYLVIKQINNAGVYKTLQLEQPAWVTEIWSQGFYPYKPPFIYDTGQGRVVSFPPAFQWINAPFYRMFGYGGIYIIPCVSLILLWVWFIVTLRRLQMPSLIVAFAFFLLAFCSPLTLYGAVYWEHTLAALLLFSGVVFLVKPGESYISSTILGLLTGLATWLRPEAIVFSGLLIVAVLYNYYRERKLMNLVFVISIVSVVLAFFIFNAVVYKSILGVHSYQVMDNADSGNCVERLTILTHINARLLIFFPSALLFYVLAGYLFIKRPPVPAMIYQLTLIIILFSFLTPFILPNAGGKQWGPRYFIILIPAMLISICLAFNWIALPFHRSLLLLPILLIVVYSVYLNVYKATKTLRDDYAFRVTPGLQFLKKQPGDVVIVQNQYIAQEFAEILESKKIFLAEDQIAQNQLQKKLRSAGVSEIIYMASSNENKPMPNELQDGKHDLRKIGDYYFGKYILP